jgi:hypothetical protein
MSPVNPNDERELIVLMVYDHNLHYLLLYAARFYQEDQNTGIDLSVHLFRRGSHLVKDGLENSNCLKAFFLFQENLINNSEHYIKKFGVKPEFKAGLQSEK